jgi:hypothetical protein
VLPKIIGSKNATRFGKSISITRIPQRISKES